MCSADYTDRHSCRSPPADERYMHVRRWYARDKGETTLRDVLELME